MTKGYPKSFKASSIGRQLDLQCYMGQNVGLLKGDMFNS